MNICANFFALNEFKLGYSNVFVVDFDGKSGVLAMLWKDYVHLDIVNYSVKYIYCLAILKSAKGNRNFLCAVTMATLRLFTIMNFGICCALWVVGLTSHGLSFGISVKSFMFLKRVLELNPRSI